MMSKNKFLAGLLAIGVIPCFLFSSTANTASLTDIKEALSMVIHMVEEQSSENNSKYSGIKAFEKRYQQENVISRIDVLEQKISALEKKLSDEQRHSQVTTINKSGPTILDKNVQEADQTISRFLKSKNKQ